MAHATHPAHDPASGSGCTNPREIGTVDTTRAAEGTHDVSSAWIMRIGGVAALARLDYHAGTTATWWAIVALSVFTDLLFVPVSIALYTALRRSSEPAMLLATAFTLLFVALDLAVTWPAYASLITLGREYATATTADQRTIIVAAAGYPSAVLGSPLQSIDSILTLSIGILVTGLVILRGALGRTPAIMGVATGLVGIASVAHTALTGEVSPLAIAASQLTIGWLVLVGRDLVRSRWSSAAAGP